MNAAELLSRGAKFKNGGTPSRFGAESGFSGSEVASKTPSSISRCRFLGLGLILADHFVQFLVIVRDRVGHIAEADRNHLGIGHSHDGSSSNLRERASIDKSLVGEMGVPVEIIVDRVINAAFILARKTKVESGYASMVEEWSVVGAISKRCNANIGPIAELSAVVCIGCEGQVVQIARVPRR